MADVEKRKREEKQMRTWYAAGRGQENNAEEGNV